jgi:hypothetical protein
MKAPFFFTDQPVVDVPSNPSIGDRVRRLPEAMLLTAGYYTARMPIVGGLLRERI